MVYSSLDRYSLIRYTFNFHRFHVVRHSCKDKIILPTHLNARCLMQLTLRYDGRTLVEILSFIGQFVRPAL